MRVLIADDDPVMRHLMAHQLASWDFEPVVCSDGLQVLAMLGEDSLPPLALIDWKMPGVDGIALCEEIRRAREPAPAYIILVTSNSLREHVVSGLSAGADDYVVKPVDWDVLRARVNIGCRTVRLQERLLHLSMVDELTGVYNRRGFTVMSERHLTLARRKALPVLLFAIDIDGLKAINDQHGHAAGDRALTATAGILRSTYRSADLVARLGGDEFVVFPLEASPDSSGLLLNRLQSNIDAYNVRQPTEGTLSISAGVAQLDSTACVTVEGLLLAADRELYRQKRQRLGVVKREGFEPSVAFQDFLGSA